MVEFHAVALVWFGLVSMCKVKWSEGSVTDMMKGARASQTFSFAQKWQFPSTAALPAWSQSLKD